MADPTIEQLLPKDIITVQRAPEGMKTFTIYRQEDETGISGTGIVIQGVLFANGKCVIQWLSGPDPGDTQVKDDWNKFLDTHVKSHPANKSIITYGDGTQEIFSEETNA